MLESLFNTFQGLRRFSCCSDIKEIWIYVDITPIISSHLRFDMMEIYLMTLLIICVLIGQTIVATFFVAN